MQIDNMAINIGIFNVLYGLVEPFYSMLGIDNGTSKC